MMMKNLPCARPVFPNIIDDQAALSAVLQPPRHDQDHHNDNNILQPPHINHRNDDNI